MIKDQLNQDLKTAMLAGDKTLATTLRGLKSAILYVEVANGNRDEGLSDDAIIEVFTKEAKKRQESADLFAKGGNQEKAEAELTEKTVIEKYLPAQLTDEELAVVIDQVVAEAGAESMGPIIGRVKQLTHGKADGQRIATAVKERLAP